MNNIEKLKVLKAIIKQNGIKYQSMIAIEECSELIKELTKFMRGNKNRMKLLEEIADVEICLSELKLYFKNITEVEIMKSYKLNRLKLFYINKEEQNGKV